jgi:hypothetical protein
MMLLFLYVLVGAALYLYITPFFSEKERGDKMLFGAFLGLWPVIIFYSLWESREDYKKNGHKYEKLVKDMEDKDDDL